MTTDRMDCPRLAQDRHPRAPFSTDLRWNRVTEQILHSTSRQQGKCH